MQYKIPIQIENEDTIVAGLSIRQIIILMIWWGAAYGVFQMLYPDLGPYVASVPTAIIAILGIIIALTRISEMTFLPAVLNFFRLTLNSKERAWSMGTDSYSDLEVGYAVRPSEARTGVANTSIDTKMSDEASTKIGRL